MSSPNRPLSVAAAAAIVLWAGGANANGAYPGAYLPPGAGCESCHSAGNLFRPAWEAQCYRRAWSSCGLRGLDTDGDGFTNDEEFVLGTNPGQSGDVNECLEGLATCSVHAACSDGPAKDDFACSCPGGFTGSGTPGSPCVDVEECQQNPVPCVDPVSSCVERTGGFDCACPPGYFGDGKIDCSEIDACAAAPCSPLTTCTQSGGIRSCGPCPDGYEGDGATCTDVDECAANNGDCDPLTLCANTDGSRTCGLCPTGYSGDGVTGCVLDGACDANECATYGVCSGTGCVCVAGFSGDGQTCADVDECGNNPCGNAACANLPGTFLCTCQAAPGGLPAVVPPREPPSFPFPLRGAAALALLLLLGGAIRRVRPAATAAWAAAAGLTFFFACGGEPEDAIQNTPDGGSDAPGGNGPATGGVSNPSNGGSPNAASGGAPAPSGGASPGGGGPTSGGALSAGGAGAGGSGAGGDPRGAGGSDPGAGGSGGANAGGATGGSPQGAGGPGSGGANAGGANTAAGGSSGTPECTRSCECEATEWCNPGSGSCEPRVPAVPVDFEDVRGVFGRAGCMACHFKGGSGDVDSTGSGLPAIFAGSSDVAYRHMIAGGVGCASGPHRICVDEPSMSLLASQTLDTPENQGKPSVAFSTWSDPDLQVILRWIASGAPRGTTALRCGDYTVQAGEQCDEGPSPPIRCDHGTPQCTLCNEQCTFQSATGPICGDGNLDPGHEICDDGNLVVDQTGAHGGAVCGPNCTLVPGIPCGGQGQVCCNDSPACGADLRCEGGRCAPSCGVDGTPCCNHAVAETHADGCVDGATCDGGTCAACGGEFFLSQRCCPYAVSSSSSGCYEGFDCDAGSCTECGYTFGPCCKSGFDECLDSLTYCEFGYCEPHPPMCGNIGQECCFFGGSGTCNEGECLQDFTCGYCGSGGEPCCDFESCNDSSLACDPTTNTCEACGGQGQACCEFDTCDAGLGCSYSSQRCGPCGELGEPCCDFVCDAPWGCDGLANECETCGDLGEPCCDPDLTCNGPLQCDFNFECTN